MQSIFTTSQALIAVLGLGAVQFLLATWLKARLEASIRAEQGRIDEQYKYDIQVRRQAAMVAEYFSYYYRLKPDSSTTDYRMANQLIWELTLWLPEDTYKLIRNAVASPDDNNNILSALIAVRKLLIKNPGDLSQDDVVFHAPHAGRDRNG